MWRGIPENCDGSGRVVLNIRRPGTPSVYGHVAAKTDERAFELRRIVRGSGALIERVEHDACGLVVRGHLDDVTVAHPAERDAVVEEDRAGVLLADLSALQAGS